MKKTTLYKINAFVTLAIFLLMIYIPFIGALFQKDQSISTVEKRTLAKPPNIPASKKTLTQFPRQMDAYYADHFGFRETIIQYYYDIKNLFDQNDVSDDVTFGTDGWMFLGGIKKGYTNYENPIGDVMHTDLYSQEGLKQFAHYINTVSNWLKQKGIKYIFVIAPNKHTIYFDKLPAYITKQNPDSSTDQLVHYLTKYTDTPIVDLRKALLKEKDKQQLYYKTDTHWNYLGANIAQYEITKTIEKIFPNQIIPKLLTKNKFIQHKRPGGDLSHFAKLRNITEDDYRPRFNQNCTVKRVPPHSGIREPFTSYCPDGKLTALIFRDSFFTALVPYIERKFKYSTYIWEKLSYKKLKKYTDEHHYDIVIEEWVERSFPYVPNTKGF